MLNSQVGPMRSHVEFFVLDWPFSDDEEDLSDACYKLFELQIMPRIIALAPSRSPSTT